MADVRWAALAAALLASGCILSVSVEPAVAVVEHQSGYSATVLGWTSWYGSYGMGPLGIGWCIDHGIRAPDAAFNYVPTDVPDASADVKAALSWAAGLGAISDRQGSAAVMLVLHDLMGARYPFGRIDVDRLERANLDGFDGHEGEIIRRARSIKAQARSHAHLRAPLRLQIDAPPVAPGGASTVRMTLADAKGAPVSGVPIHIRARSAMVAPVDLWTGEDGTATAALIAGPGTNSIEAEAVTPDPILHAFSPTKTAAQRIVQPAYVKIRAAAEFSQPTTTTSTATTRPPTTSTTSTSTTSTSTTTRPPTTTTAPPTSTSTSTSTTARPTTTSTSSPSTVPPTTASTTGPDTPPAGDVPAPPLRVGGTLPYTGRRVASWAFLGAGLVLIGGGASATARRRLLRGPEYPQG